MIDVFIAISVAVVIILNILMVRYIIRRAVKKFVVPVMENNDLSLVNYKWAGLFNFGDFKNETIELRPAMSGGNPFLSIYVYVYYKDSDINKRLTIRIDTFFIFIRRVLYSRRIE